MVTTNTTFIYLIHDPVGRALKIGRSDNPIQRLGNLQSAHPRSKLKLLGMFAAKPFIEQDLHKELEEFRLNGEWFEEAGEVIETFLEFSRDISMLVYYDCPTFKKKVRTERLCDELQSIADDLKGMFNL
jgi:hypothetical protein